MQMVPIGGGSTKFVLSNRWIVYTKSRKQLLHRKYLLYETGCIIIYNCPCSIISLYCGKINYVLVIFFFQFGVNKRHPSRYAD